MTPRLSLSSKNNVSKEQNDDDAPQMKLAGREIRAEATFPKETAF
jgi:hypothetical protein